VESAMTNVESFGRLLKVLEFDNKRELEKYCRELTIDSEDFFYLILASQQGLLAYNHRIHHRDIEPIETDEFGRLKGHSLKFFRKASQIFRVRRYLVGHLFYSGNHRYWHFFYFDQRDQSTHSNHWKHGPHIHFINWLWPNYTAKSLWHEFTSVNPKMRGALHIKYSEPNKEG
jgi:hypothetical protein